MHQALLSPVVAPQRQSPSTIHRLRSTLWLGRTPVLLVLITLLAGILRLARLDQPALWGDEAHTFSRVCGTYQQLIDILQYNGFVPLHYELYWWIRQGLPMRFHIGQAPATTVDPPERPRRTFSWFGALKSDKPADVAAPKTKRELQPSSPLIKGGVTMTPRVMRLVPALAGTLMAPAMYFLAIHLVDRRRALLAALLAATSAYLLVYARDAKMYSHFWLMCTLSAACLFWWLRVRTRLAWLCWVASSIAMCGLHAPGMILVAIELLIFLFHLPQWRLDWRPPVFFIAGIVVILSGPIGYYRFFNHYHERVETGGWNNTGLEWIDYYNRDRTAPDLLRFTSTAYLVSWEWPTPPDQRSDDGSMYYWNRRPMLGQRAMPVIRLRLYKTAAWVLAGVLVLGLLPWRRFTAARVGARLASPAGDTSVAPTGIAGLTLLAWLVLPLYGFYCASTKDFVAPHGWVTAPFVAIWASGFPQLLWLSVQIVPIFGAVIAYATAGLALLLVLIIARSPRRYDIARVAVASLIVLTLCEAIFWLMRLLVAHSVVNGHSVWMPRYLGFCWPAVAIVVAILLTRLPTRPLRYGAIALFVAINLAQYANRAFASSEPPSDLLAGDVMNAQSRDGRLSSTRTYTRLSDNFGFGPGQGVMFTPSWRYYLILYSGITPAPMELRFPRGTFDSQFQTWLNTTPSQIISDLRRTPQIDRVIVWERLDYRLIDSTRDDPLKSQLAALPGNWRRISERLFRAKDHWTSQDQFTCRRREYVRMVAVAPAGGS